MRLSHYEINEAMTTLFRTVATAVQILNNFTLQLVFPYNDRNEDRLFTKESQSK